MIVLHATAQNGQLVFNNKDEAIKVFLGLDKVKLIVRVDKERFTRTMAQNNSIHLYLDMLAKELNQAGIPLKLVLEKLVDIECTKDNLKETLWRPIQIATISKTSTTKLEKTQQIDVIYDHVNRFISENFHIHVPFPNDPDKNKPAITVENYPENNLEPKF